MQECNPAAVYEWAVMAAGVAKPARNNHVSSSSCRRQPSAFESTGSFDVVRDASAGPAVPVFNSESIPGYLFMYFIRLSEQD